MGKQKKCILIEEGKNRYSKEKMQGAGLVMYICTSDSKGIKDTFVQINKSAVNNATIYVIGESLFHSNVEKACKSENKKSKRQYTIKKAGSEDEVMAELEISFPVEAQSTEKPLSEEKKNLVTGYEQFEGSPFSKSDISAFLMALDELSTIQVFPPTAEVMYDAMITITNRYMFDKSKAKAMVDYYLKNIARKNQKNDEKSR